MSVNIAYRIKSMKKTATIIIAVAALGLQACAIQGTHSLKPNGITINRSLRLGSDAFNPNPFEQKHSQTNISYVNDSDYSPRSQQLNRFSKSHYITNNYYSNEIVNNRYFSNRECEREQPIIITPVY